MQRAVYTTLGKEPPGDRPVNYEMNIASGLPKTASAAIDKPSDLKFASWSGHLQDNIGLKDPVYRSLIYQTSQGVVWQSDRKHLKSSFRRLTMNNERTIWRSNQKVELSHFYLSRALIRDLSETLVSRGKAELEPFTGHLDIGFADLLDTTTREILHPHASQPQRDLWAQLLVERLLRIDPSIQGRIKPPRQRDMSPERLAKLQEKIEAELDTPLALDQLAAVVGFERFHFARAFKAATGQSPHQYILDRRVARARQLLEGKEIFSLAEVAYTVGFSSQAHMTDVFRKRLGVTPGIYRREQMI